MFPGRRLRSRASQVGRALREAQARGQVRRACTEFSWTLRSCERGGILLIMILMGRSGGWGSWMPEVSAGTPWAGASP